MSERSPHRSPSCLSLALSHHEAKANTPTPAVLHILKTLASSDFPYRLSDQHDDLLVTVKGVEHVLSAKMIRG